MGTYVDPEKMIKARGAGMSPEELLKRGYPVNSRRRRKWIRRH
jgi:hypothetical protein